MRGDILVATDEGTTSHAVDDQMASARGKSVGKKPRKGSVTEDRQVGRVLQNVYQQTIDEDIPAEMLDLLNKLK